MAETGSSATPGAAERGVPPVIDAHQHVWDPDVAPDDYAWLSGPYAALRRVFTLDDLRPALAASGVDGTVLVQTRSSFDESRSLLKLAAADPLVRGVVAWVDLTAPGVAERIDELRAGPGGARLVAIRHQVHDEPDPEWLGRADVRRGLAAVESAGLAYDLLLRPRELPAALDVTRAMPNLRFVIDHIAKPPIAAGTVEPWASLMAAFGPLDHVACKVSGMVTEADLAHWTVADLRPYVDHVLAVFGPARLLYGSDWPVCLAAAPYQRMIGATRQLVGGLSDAEQARIFGGTAREVYRIA